MENTSPTRYAIEPRELGELSHRFNYHAPKGDQVIRYAEIRKEIERLAVFISERVPRSRELSTALTHLDHVMFNANAAIARNEK